MKSFTKKYVIKASAQKVFDALTNPKLIEVWSGSTAKMNAKAGSLFSLWGGSIHGKNLEVSPTKIVQHWKEDKWKDFTTVSFQLDEAKGATTVKLVHEEIPDGSFKNIKDGWDQYYMLPLKEFVEAQG
jgi:activator of HSP90 ATPase